MASWRGHPSVKPGARMTAAIRRMRAHTPTRPGMRPSATPVLATVAVPSVRTVGWTASRTPAPGLVPRVVHR